MSFYIQEVFLKLRPICAEIASKPTLEKLNELRALILLIPSSMLQGFQDYLLFPLNVHLRENMIRNEEVKRVIVDTIKDIFNLTRLEKPILFFEFNVTLVLQIYAPASPNQIANIHEEYKLSIIECYNALCKSMSWDVVMGIYHRQNAPKFAQIIFISLELAKTEKLRKLRIAAIECILTIARLHDEADLSDKEIYEQVADMFWLFLPKIASTLGNIALEDNKVGHKIIVVALKSFGKLITLVMQNYGAVDEEVDLSKMQLELNKPVHDELKEQNFELKSKEDLDDFVEKSLRTTEWYKNADLKLKSRIHALAKLHNDPHPKIRSELADMCNFILENCVRTMPESTGKIVEILLVLSEDDYEEIRSKSINTINILSLNFSKSKYKVLLDSLQEDFFNYVTNLPNMMNSSEENKIGTLNLLIGYLKLFRGQQLINIFHSHLHLKRLMLGLIFICRLNSNTVSILEEYSSQALDANPMLKTPWKQLSNFHNETLIAQQKISIICSLLVDTEVFDIVSDYLLEIYLTEAEHRKEATFLLNELVAVKGDYDNIHIVKNIINIYTESENWYLTLTVSKDSRETLLEVQNNIIQVCLVTEGIGKIASMLGNDFQQFMLKCLYLVLERAGSGLPLVQEAGLCTLANISKACGYSDVTDLISKNNDYFSFHVMRRLKKIEENENVLNVLAVVMEHSSIEVLQYISDIVDGVLMQTFDKFQASNINSFLRIFFIFTQCLHKWLKIQINKTLPNVKDEEDFKVSGINYDNFSGDKMESNTAEEMYKEDLEIKEQQLKEDELDELYKKPDPPLHIKLTVSIIKRALHFLPSKEKNRKLLVVEILKTGLEVIREWEDELLPLVHQTWSPLVERFKEFDEPLIIKLSFQLLITLAKLSKHFIRSRTAKDVLPSITLALKKFSAESRLKDKGSMYRYTQAYKLQLEILNDLALLIICLEMPKDDVKILLETVFIYLSDKQPLPLQESTVNLTLTLINYKYKSVIVETLKYVASKENERNAKVIFDYLK